MNVLEGACYSTPDGYWSAGSAAIGGQDKPCLVVTDYEANVVYHFCDDRSPLLSTTFRSVPCCEKSVRCIVVPLPAEAGNE